MKSLKNLKLKNYDIVNIDRTPNGIPYFQLKHKKYDFIATIMVDIAESEFYILNSTELKKVFEKIAKNETEFNILSVDLYNDVEKIEKIMFSK